MARNVNRRDILKGTGAVGLAGIAGCLDGGDGGDGSDGSDGSDGGDGSDGADGEDGMDGSMEIDLGLLMGVTGGLEELGPPIRNAAELVPTQVEDADTNVTINTQFEDTETDPQVGVSGAEALVDADINMIVGALASSVSMAVAEDVTIPNGVVQMSPASTTPAYTNLEGDWTFRTAVPDLFQGQVLADIAAERLEAESAATFVQDDAYGTGLGGAFADAFENEHDGEITEEVVFTPDEQTSFTGSLENALADDPDTILFVTFPEDGVTIFRDFYSNFDRNDMPLLVADGLQDSGLPGEVGFDMTNVTGTAPIGDGPGVDEFQSLFEDTYDEDPSQFAFVRQSYDAAAVLALAGAAAGENDGEAIRDQIRPVTESGGTEVTPNNIVEGLELAADGEDVQYRGVSGEITFDENGDQGNVAYNYFGFTEDGLESLDTIQL